MRVGKMVGVCPPFSINNGL